MANTYLTYWVVRVGDEWALLRKCTPEQPLSISFPTAESPTAKVEWGPHTLFDESKAARP